MMQFDWRIAECMADEGCTVKDIAAALGCTRESVFRWSGRSGRAVRSAMLQAAHDVSPQFLAECLRLDDETGNLYWLERPRHHFISELGWRIFNRDKANTRADLSTYPTRGYRRVRLRLDGLRVAIAAHRAVFALVHGRWPTGVIDHIDRDKLNNRPSNLRDVSQRVNCQNRGTRELRA